MSSREEFLTNCRAFLVGVTGTRDELFSDKPIAQRPVDDGQSTGLDRALEWEDWVREQKELSS